MAGNSHGDLRRVSSKTPEPELQIAFWERLKWTAHHRALLGSLEPPFVLNFSPFEDQHPLGHKAILPSPEFQPGILAPPDTQTIFAAL